MKQINTIGFDTRFGFRVTELLHGDLAELSSRVDVMIISAFAGSYVPLSGTLIHALQERHGINIESLHQQPAIDLTNALGVWLTCEMDHGPARRFLCLEMRGGAYSIDEALDNVFAALMVLQAKHIPVETIVMPLLGTGSQGVDPAAITERLLPRVRAYLENNLGTSLVQFVERDEVKVGLVSQAMDKALGRVRVTVPQEQLAQSIRVDVANRLSECSELFGESAGQLKSDWLKFLQNQKASSVEFGILGRKLVELLVSRWGIPAGNLADRVRALERTGTVPPWTCGYMHVLRHLGNDAAHAGTQAGGTHLVTPSDLVAGLYCVQRLLDQWIDMR